MNWKSALLGLGVLAIVAITLFRGLDHFPIRIWDESRLAINAYEMWQGGDYIVTDYEGAPDMWNTKPPLMLWLQALCYDIMGMNEAALRLPAALAALLCCLLLIYSCHRLVHIHLGFLSALILVSFIGFVGEHGSRTGDYDALLCLFTTASALLVFRYDQAPKSRYLYLFALCIIGGVWTKGVAALLFLPSIGLYLLFRRRILDLIKNKHFYISSVVFIVGALSYYFLREAQNPGYLQAVYENELGGRYLVTRAQHLHPWYFYLKNFIETRSSDWYLFLPIACLFPLFSKHDISKRLLGFLSLLVGQYLLVVSMAQTKLEWYDMPIYPLLAMVLALGIYHAWQLVSAQLKGTSSYLAYVLLFIVLALPVSLQVHRICNPHEEQKAFYASSYFLQTALHKGIDDQRYRVVYDDYNVHLKFYVHALQDRGDDVEFAHWNALETGDRAIVHKAWLKNHIRTNYTVEETVVNEHLSLFDIR